MKTSKILNSCIFFLLLLASCEGIFVPDPVDPQLPKYTETGNDVAGALVNGETWRSVESSDFNKVINAPSITADTINDSLFIAFQGQTCRYELFKFHLAGFQVKKFSDLEKLKDTKIILDGKNNFATITYWVNSSPIISSMGTGQIYLRQVQQCDSIHIILSGTFGFTVQNENNETLDVSYGRFDYYIYQPRDFKMN